MTIKVNKFEVSKVERKHWNQRDSEVTVQNPAVMSGSVKARQLTGKVAMANQLGTPRPTHLLTGLSDDKSILYFLPAVNSEDPDAVEVSYSRSGFTVNLYELFQTLGRLVLEGTREVYAWQALDEAVEVGRLSGRALYIELGSAQVEAIRSKK